MSYSLGTIIEIDLATGRPVPPPPPPPRREPTVMSDRTALVVGLAFAGVFALAIWKAPKGAWRPVRTYRRKPYYKKRREPTIRIRLNRRTSR